MLKISQSEVIYSTTFIIIKTVNEMQLCDIIILPKNIDKAETDLSTNLQKF